MRGHVEEPSSKEADRIWYVQDTGVKHDTVAEVMRVANGCIVGSSLKVDGDTWNAVDPDRARDFMDRAKAAR